VLLTAWPKRPWAPIPPIYPGQGCVAKSWPQEHSSGLLLTERLSGIHANAHYAAALRQRIRDLIGAKQSGFMPENGGLQCTNVRIPDSLSVIKSIRGADADTPESNRSSSKTPSRIASSGAQNRHASLTEFPSSRASFVSLDVRLIDAGRSI